MKQKQGSRIPRKPCLFIVLPEGLEIAWENTGRTALSGNGGHPCGHQDVANLKQQAIDDLQRAWKSIRRLEDLSDDPRESKAAGLAVKHVDKAFRELERKGLPVKS